VNLQQPPTLKRTRDDEESKLFVGDDGGEMMHFVSNEASSVNNDGTCADSFEVNQQQQQQQRSKKRSKVSGDLAAVNAIPSSFSSSTNSSSSSSSNSKSASDRTTMDVEKASQASLEVSAGSACAYNCAEVMPEDHVCDSFVYSFGLVEGIFFPVIFLVYRFVSVFWLLVLVSSSPILNE
jgi:hypothetical protein